MVLSGLASPGSGSLLALVWVGAWVAHLVMTGAWILDVRLHRAWPVGGLLFGVGSFCVWPLYGRDLGLPWSDTLFVSWPLLTVQVALVAPCVLLACWLVRFHLKAPPSGEPGRGEAGA